MISDINISVDRDKCTACGICVERCIMDNLRLSVAPCRQSCPLHMNCQSYIRLLALGREEEAIGQVVPYLPFLGILGRVCSHPCETVCERGEVDDPVHIRAIKRYLADSAEKKGIKPGPVSPDTGRSAAVIGSGPAGLMAAFRLRLQGHRVVVFEADAQPGGLMRRVIPAFRLPSTVLDQAVDMLADMGIAFRTGQKVGRDIDFDRIKKEYDALVVALGAGRPVIPSIEGLDSVRTIQAMDLLRDLKAGERPDLGGTVAVIGGGETAVDAALACRRLGVGSVVMICLERQDEMPAAVQSIGDVLEEGVIVENCWGVSRLAAAGADRIEIGLSRCLSVFDARGTFAPQLEPVCRESLFASTVILATGQRFDDAGCPSELSRLDNGFLAADPLTRQSPDHPGVFICGDAVSGPSSIVQAMASAWEAALSADRYLLGDSLTWDRDFWNGSNVSQFESKPERAVGGKRGVLPGLPLADRNMEDEQELTLSAGQAKQEAERCLSCGRSFEMNRTCWFCLPCEIECPTQALQVRMPYLVR